MQDQRYALCLLKTDYTPSPHRVPRIVLIVGPHLE
jgi:hypothetical protein